MNEYLNGHISNEEVIKRLLELAQNIKAGLDAVPNQLTEDETAPFAPDNLLTNF